jgi:hypothetical protein
MVPIAHTTTSTYNLPSHRRKVKCDGQRPSCENCRNRQDDCEYPTTLLPGGYALDITNYQPQFSPPGSAHSMSMLLTEAPDTEQSQRSAMRDNFQQRLLAIFWSTHHSVELCACIHRPSFETEYLEPQNEFLMYAISSLSAIYLSDEETRAHTNDMTAATLSSSYAERARTISRRTSDSPSSMLNFIFPCNNSVCVCSSTLISICDSSKPNFRTTRPITTLHIVRMDVYRPFYPYVSRDATT